MTTSRVILRCSIELDQIRIEAIATEYGEGFITGLINLGYMWVPGRVLHIADDKLRKAIANPKSVRPGGWKRADIEAAARERRAAQVRQQAQRPPAPARDWPRWAKNVKRMRKSGEIGVGDTVKRIAAKVGGERFKRWTKKLNIPCRCTERQALWNAMYPYDGVVGQEGSLKSLKV